MPFPNPEATDAHGLLCAGGTFSADLLIEAYSRGIFPWPQEGLPILWYCPPQRGVLDFTDFHCPRSVRKLINKNIFSVTRDQAFLKVMKECARVLRKGQGNGTWIVPGMFEAYGELFKRGLAHSVEAWIDGELVGGLYGVKVNGLFSGESMFFRHSGASKVCLVQLVEWLINENATWVDIQMVTPLLEQFGGKYISRAVFLERLGAQKTN